MKTRTTLMAIGLMALVSAAQAANPPASLVMIPPQINYQGRLVTAANVPYSDATHRIDLSLYPTASGGARMWAERYDVVTRDGYFSVNLGASGTMVPGVSNPPIWTVLWRTNVDSPDTFFMALTVRTRPDGSNEPSPAEATPRQQFLTAPFAYRAHQSVYATKADGRFNAAEGVETPSLFSTTNEIGVNAPLRVSDGGGGTIYANSVQAHGASPGLKLLNANGPVALGINYLGGISVGPSHASSMFIGSQANAAGPGTSVFVDGRTVDIGTPSFTFNNRPMFIRRNALVTTAASTTTSVPHGINLSQYDVMVVGWLFVPPAATSVQVRGVTQHATSAAADVSFSANPPAGSVVAVHFLGTPKGMMDYP